MKEKAISVVEDFDFDIPKTKSFTDVVNALGLSDKKALFVLGSVNKNIYLSSRNLKRSSVVTNSEISTYNIMNAQHLVLLESSLEQIESNLS